MDDIYGPLAADPTFRTAFVHALETLWTHGTKSTLERYLAGTL